jgi:hypothetical protein
VRGEGEEDSGGRALWDIRTLYLPGSHFTHVPPSSPVLPMLHRQSVAVLLPTGAYEFAGHAEQALSAICAVAAEYLPPVQSSQAELSVLVLYLPGKHPVHAPPPLLVYPGRQAQSVGPSLPAAECEFGVHCKHELSNVCQLDAEYLPGNAAQTFTSIGA